MFVTVLFITYMKVFRLVIFNIHSFFSTLKLYTICFFKCFLSNPILFWWISVIYFNFCATLLWFFMWQILRAIGNLCIDILTSASTAKFYFSHTKHLLKKYNIYTWSLKLLCSIIWHQYLFATITNFSILSFFFPSIQRHPLVFYKIGCLNF